MIWINEKLDILTDDEILFLDNKCKNFIATEEPKLYSFGLSKNYYNRLSFKNEETNERIIEKLVTYVQNITNNKKINYWGGSINKVFNSSNENDDLHTDISDYTIILYLNDDFSGGEFEYINENGESVKIKPKKNLCIISTDKLKHRVLPVIDGERYSLVIFLMSQNKSKSTLI